MTARKIHWVEKIGARQSDYAFERAACGAYRDPRWFTTETTAATCGACKRTTAFRVALEAEWNAEQWKARGGA